MTFIVPLFLLARLVLAAPATSVSEISGINVHFEVDKSLSATSLTIVDAAGEIIGKTCSNKLDEGKFEHWPIFVNLDESGNGTGNITLGGTSHRIAYNDNPDAAVSCDRLYNEEAIFVSCKATVPKDVDLSPTGKKLIGECFPDTRESLSQVAHAMAAGGPTDLPEFIPIELGGIENTTEVGNPNSKRQSGPCSQWSPDTRPDGNGDPWQHHLYTQMSETHACGNAASCTAGYNVGKGMAFNANLNGASQWISGGFGVEFSWTSGNSYECTGNSHDEVCVWYDQAFTEYKVISGSRNGCGQFSPNRKTHISSPNRNNKGGKFYCVSGGHCRSKGERYWELYTRRGGP